MCSEGARGMGTEGAMRIALLCGGRSGEHEVSLASGKAAEAALRERGHDVLRVAFGKEGGASWQAVGASEAPGEGGTGAALAALEAWGPDAAFIAMHGPDGEDGRVQAALELLGVPYQGSGVQASALCLDKPRTKALYESAGLPTAADQTIHPGDRPDWPALARELGLPLVLKTAQSGSSVGVEVVETEDELASRGGELLSQTWALLVESWLPGREFTVCVLEAEDGSLRALPIIEIRPRTARFFDYEAKYTPGATDEICPARIDDALAARLSELACRAHTVLGCRGYSRTDLKCDATGAPRLLETNTLPGLTRTSLFPQAAAAAGIPFGELLEALLARGVERAATRAATP